MEYMHVGCSTPISGTLSPILTGIINCLLLYVSCFAAGCTNQSYSLEDIGDEESITYLCSNMVKTPLSMGFYTS